MEVDAQFIIKIKCEFMVVFTLFCPVLSHVSMVLLITKNPPGQPGLNSTQEFGELKSEMVVRDN